MLIPVNNFFLSNSIENIFLNYIEHVDMDTDTYCELHFKIFGLDMTTLFQAEHYC